MTTERTPQRRLRTKAGTDLLHALVAMTGVRDQASYFEQVAAVEAEMLDPAFVGRVIDEHYRARLAADPKGPRVHECGSYCGADIAERLRQ